MDRFDWTWSVGQMYLDLTANWIGWHFSHSGCFGLILPSNLDVFLYQTQQVKPVTLWLRSFVPRCSELRFSKWVQAKQHRKPLLFFLKKSAEIWWTSALWSSQVIAGVNNTFDKQLSLTSNDCRLTCCAASETPKRQKSQRITFYHLVILVKVCFYAFQSFFLGAIIRSGVFSQGATLPSLVVQCYLNQAMDKCCNGFGWPVYLSICLSIYLSLSIYLISSHLISSHLIHLLTFIAISSKIWGNNYSQAVLKAILQDPEKMVQERLFSTLDWDGMASEPSGWCC